MEVNGLSSTFFKISFFWRKKLREQRGSKVPTSKFTLKKVSVYQSTILRSIFGNPYLTLFCWNKPDFRVYLLMSLYCIVFPFTLCFLIIKIKIWHFFAELIQKLVAEVEDGQSNDLTEQRDIKTVLPVLLQRGEPWLCDTYKGEHCVMRLDIIKK